jgi:hypothetical protein
MEFCADDAELAELSASPPALADDSDTNRRSPSRSPTLFCCSSPARGPAGHDARVAPRWTPPPPAARPADAPQGSPPVSPVPDIWVPDSLSGVGLPNCPSFRPLELNLEPADSDDEWPTTIASCDSPVAAASPPLVSFADPLVTAQVTWQKPGAKRMRKTPPRKGSKAKRRSSTAAMAARIVAAPSFGSFGSL